MESLDLWNKSSTARLLCKMESEGETRINPSMREKKIFWCMRSGSFIGLGYFEPLAFLDFPLE